MKLILALFAALATQAYAATNFYGMVAANAVGGKAPYTCRTQTDVSFLLPFSRGHGPEASDMFADISDRHGSLFLYVVEQPCEND